MNSFSLLQEMLSINNNNTKAINFLIDGIKYELGRLDDNKKNKFTDDGSISNQLRINGYTNNELLRLWNLYSRIVQDTTGVNSEQVASLNKLIKDLEDDYDDLQDEKEDFLKIREYIYNSFFFTNEKSNVDINCNLIYNSVVTTAGSLVHDFNTFKRYYNMYITTLKRSNPDIFTKTLYYISLLHFFEILTNYHDHELIKLKNNLQEIINIRIIIRIINDAFKTNIKKIKTLKDKKNVDNYINKIILKHKIDPSDIMTQIDQILA